LPLLRKPNALADDAAVHQCVRPLQCEPRRLGAGHSVTRGPRRPARLALGQRRAWPSRRSHPTAARRAAGVKPGRRGAPEDVARQGGEQRQQHGAAAGPRQQQHAHLRARHARSPACAMFQHHPGMCMSRSAHSIANPRRHLPALQLPGLTSHVCRTTAPRKHCDRALPPEAKGHADER